MTHLIRNANLEEKRNHTCFGSNLYSARTQHGNLHQLSVTMSRMTYIILRAHWGTCVSHIDTGKHQERLWKNAVEWTGREEISKGEFPGSSRSKHGYIRICFGLKKGKTFELWVFLDRCDLNFRVRSSPLWFGLELNAEPCTILCS